MRESRISVSGVACRGCALIGELAMKSAEFASMWSEHRVRKWDLATYRMHHPLVGRMRLDLQTPNVPQEEDRRIVVPTADRRLRYGVGGGAASSRTGDRPGRGAHGGHGAGGSH